MYKINAILVAVVLLGNASRCFSLEGGGDVNTIISDFNSRDPMRIEKGYNELYSVGQERRKKYRQNPQIKEAYWEAFLFLVPKPILLSQRNKDVESPSLAMLMLSDMGQFQETRAIPYLLKNIHNTGHALALATMGDGVVDPVLAILVNGDDAEKTGAAVVLGQMLLPKSEAVSVTQWESKKQMFVTSMRKLSPEDYEPVGKIREKIKTALKNKLKTRDPKEKIHILNAFRYVADEDDIEELKGIAKEDTYKEGSRYFVREKAEKILEEINAKKAGQIAAGSIGKAAATR